MQGSPTMLLLRALCAETKSMKVHDSFHIHFIFISQFIFIFIFISTWYPFWCFHIDPFFCVNFARYQRTHGQRASFTEHFMAIFGPSWSSPGVIMGHPMSSHGLLRHRNAMAFRQRIFHGKNCFKTMETWKNCFKMFQKSD